MSGTPNADINAQTIILRYETTEKDPEKIKNLWKKDIEEIKKNLGWIGDDLKKFNNSLVDDIRILVNKRKKEAEENQSLIDKIKS